MFKWSWPLSSILIKKSYEWDRSVQERPITFFLWSHCYQLIPCWERLERYTYVDSGYANVEERLECYDVANKRREFKFEVTRCLRPIL